ncbi:transcriptional regulator [Salipaludibacillus keqinensis]|uniref:Transcriptional regulator n=2 Tax=Salipaludibacillus keqinensis TaxID=2045207 RepID=A0A323TRX5_9BACI|nr:transcriptional regulator [Salipaludibacillus keqinensis]
MAYIDRGFYAQIENGTRDPSIHVAKKIANALFISPAAFFSHQIEVLFESSLIHSPIVVAHFDLELKYTWIFNPHNDFDPNDLLGKTDEQITKNDGTIALMNLKREVIETNHIVRKKITFPTSEGFITYDVFGKPILEAGHLIGGTTVSSDVTHLIT